MTIGLITSSVVAFLPVNNVSAAGSMADNFSLDDQVKSYVYYRALGACATYDGSNLPAGVGVDWHTRISRQNAQANQWFAGDVGFSTATIGVYLDGVQGVKANSEGRLDCSQTGLVSGALALWGKWAPDQALCAMGFRSSNDDEFKAGRCTNAQGGSDDFRRGDNIVAAYQGAVKGRVYGGNEPALSDAAKYLLYLNTFQKLCVPNATISQTKPIGSTDKDYAVRQPARSGSEVVTPTTYYTSTSNLPQNSTVLVSPRNDFSTLFADGSSCGNLVKAINGDSGKNNGLADKYAKWLFDHKNEQDTTVAPGCDAGASIDASGQPCPPEVASSCNIPELGWILCPLLTTGASLADSAYGFLSDNFLQTDISLVNTDPEAQTDTGQKVGTGTYTAWKIMQGLANVAFVIAVLIIIFSQLTSIGISNYGVKKLLPRVIVAAVLVNLSFFVCQLAVDLSNVLGTSLKGMLEGVASQVTASGGGTAVSTTDDSTNLAGIVTLVIAAGTLAWINVGALFIAVVGAVVSLLLIFVLLIARKVLIVLLIVIAPLAFVAYLLPNTEPLFQKWRKALTTLLLLYPIIGLLYGASLLASAIMLQVADDDIVLRIAAYLALVLPLIAVIPLLKGSLDGIGKLGGAIQSFGQKARGAAQKGAQAGYDRSRLGQFKKFRQGEADRRRAQIQGGTFRGSNRNPLNWSRNLASFGNRGANRVSGRFGSELSASGADLVDQEAEREIKTATALMTQQRLTSDELQELAHGREVRRAGRVIMRSPSEAMHQAAVRERMKNGTTGDVEQLLAGSARASERVRQEMARGIHTNGHVAKADYLGGDFADRVLRGAIGSDADIDDAAARRIQEGKLSAEAMVGQDANALERFARVSADASTGARTDVGAPQLDTLRDTAIEAMTSDQTRGKITAQKANPIDTISRL